MRVVAQQEYDPVYLVDLDEDGLVRVYNRPGRILHERVAPASIARFGGWTDPNIGDAAAREILIEAVGLRESV